MSSFLNNLPQNMKVAFRLALHLMLILLAYLCALALSKDAITVSLLKAFSLTLMLLLVAGGVCAFVTRLQFTKLESFDLDAIKGMSLWVLLVAVAALALNFLVPPKLPVTTLIIFALMLFLFAFLIRFFAQVWNNVSTILDKQSIPVAVYGAGAGGLQLVAALRNSSEYRPVLLVDDSKHLQGLNISGLRVRSSLALEDAVSRNAIKKVFLAIPSLTANKKQQIRDTLTKLDCEVLEVPSYVEIIKFGGVFRSLRPIQPEALLGRENIDVDMPDVDLVYSNSNVLISGGGGSIGSELSRKVLEIRPKKLVLLEASEIALYTIEQELSEIASQAGIELVSHLGSVLNRSLVEKIIDDHSIDVVLHAAAHKHVPLLENNVIAGVHNNIFGTKIIAEVASAKKVPRFTLISTDKAVRPTNLMGATKRFAELIVQDLHEQKAGTIFSIVRFGNVLGSSGSVIPLFKKQIEDGGPVTVTHKDVTRYFMTIPEAARLVLLTSVFAEGGDVFVLDMGEPIKIVDMAREMIELSGLTVRNEENPDGDVAIEISGLRPGEKLFEELLIGENTLPTPHPKILRAKENRLTPEALSSAIAKLEKAVTENDHKLARNVLVKVVEGYG